MCVHVCVNVLEQHVSREQSAKSEGTLRANLTRAFQFFITNRKKTASNIHATALRKEEIKFNIYRLVPWPVAHGSLCQAEREGERERERVRERVRERKGNDSFSFNTAATKNSLSASVRCKYMRTHPQAQTQNTHTHTHTNTHTHWYLCSTPTLNLTRSYPSADSIND